MRFPDKLIFAENERKNRFVGILLMLLGSIGFIGGLVKIISFGGGISSLIFIILGGTFCFAGFLFWSREINSLRLDRVLRIGAHEARTPFKTKRIEFSFDDFERVFIDESSTENDDLYTVFIVLKNGTRLEVPSDDITKKAAQTALSEQIVNFIQSQ